MLFESRAIARYIEAKYAKQGTPLVPTELKAVALFEQAASIETADFDPSASALTYEKVFKKCDIFYLWQYDVWGRLTRSLFSRYLGLQTDEARAKEHLDKLNTKLDAYEAILTKQKYLGGNVST